MGRRAGGSTARQDILAVARETFATLGYRGATIRLIARGAEVDPALIHHYFRDKATLFAACMEFPDGMERHVAVALAGDSDGIGERLTRAYLGFWEDPALRQQLTAMARSAFSNDLALDHLRASMMRVLAGSVMPHLTGDHPELRFAMAMTQLLGVAIGRYITKVPSLVEISFDQLVEVTAPAIQLHLAGATYRLPEGNDRRHME